MRSDWKKDYFRYKDFFLNVWKIYSSKPNILLYLELILSIGAIALFAVFAIRPTILTILELRNEIKSKEATIAKMDTKIRNLRTASNVLQQEAEKLRLIDLAVPKSPDIESYITQIENLATLRQLTINTLTFNDVLIKGKAPSNKSKDLESMPSNSLGLPFSVTLISPSYQPIKDFISDLENMKRPFKVDAMTIGSSIVDGNRMLTLTITGRVPYILVEEGKTSEKK